MKIAIVWNHPSRLLDCSFRFEQYEAGFQALGHETILLCRSGCEEGRPGARGVEPERFDDPSFWRDLGVDVLATVAWHRMTSLLEAARAGGLKTIAIADTDGQVGLRAHPRMTLLRMWVYLDGFRERYRCLDYFLRRYVRESFFGSEEDEAMIASTRASDLVVFGSEGARSAFRRLLKMQKALDLDRRTIIEPLLIGDAFFQPVVAAKKDRVVAIGRWDDPQKNVALLIGALQRFIAVRPQTEIEIFGAGGSELFDPLLRHERFDYRGLQPPHVVAESLLESRSIFFSSRWEGSPHAAIEALVLGATIVGTPIPALESWTDDERFGRIAEDEPQTLADALVAEMQTWDRGERDAGRIAETWRTRMLPQEVCRRLLADL